MKRKLQLLVGSTVFLTVTSVVAWLLRFVEWDFWPIFGVASGVLILGLFLLAFLGKHVFVKYLVAVINAISMGFYLRSWYINRGFDNSIWLMLFVVLIAEVYYLLAVLPTLIPKIKAVKGLYLLVFVILSIVAFICLVVFTKTTWVSTLGYFGLIQLGFVMTHVVDEKQPLHTPLVASTYTVAICALLILIIALSGGEGGSSILDGLDLSGSSGRGGGKKKKVPTSDDLLSKN